MPATAARPRRPPWKTPRRWSSPSCLPTTRSNALTRCPWTTPRRQTTAGSHHRGQRNHRGRCRRQLRDRSHLRHRRCWQQQLGLADHHRRRHHGAGVHLRACRLHGRMLDEMPMDDATSDNCGEVTIEVSRNHRGRCRRQLRDRSHLHRHRRAGNSSSACRPSPWKTPQRRSSPSCLPTTRSNSSDDAYGRRHGVRQLRRSHHRGVKRNYRGRCRATVIVRPPPPTMPATAARLADHHRGRHHSAGVHLRAADYTVECSRDAHGRRHGVRQLRRSHHRGVKRNHRAMPPATT